MTVKIFNTKITVKLTKTYKSNVGQLHNAVTHSMIIDDKHREREMARVDAEDNAAGLAGVWDLEVIKVY